ncbi:MAG: hypothetical protein ACK51M_23915, partial [Burkholderiales bacterium]
MADPQPRQAEARRQPDPLDRRQTPVAPRREHAQREREVDRERGGERVEAEQAGGEVRGQVCEPHAARREPPRGRAQNGVRKGRAPDPAGRIGGPG